MSWKTENEAFNAGRRDASDVARRGLYITAPAPLLLAYVDGTRDVSGVADDVDIVTHPAMIRDRNFRPVDIVAALSSVVEYAAVAGVDAIDVYDGGAVGFAFDNGATVLIDVANVALVRAWCRSMFPNASMRHHFRVSS